MKKLISILLALTLVLGLATVASAATLSDNGWRDDDGQYDGWVLNADGSMTLTKSNATDNANDRIWHNIEDANNFEISITVQAGADCRPAISLFGLFVALNSEGGIGDAFFIQNMDSTGNWNNFDWVHAEDGVATVKLVRENGGNLKVTITGKNNEANPLTMDMAIGNPSANNVELMMFRSDRHPQGGVATFSARFGAEQPPVEEPQGNPMTSESGWWHDDAQYDGWTVNDDGSFTLDQSKASGSCDDRIGHGIEDPNNFEITVTVQAGANCRPLIKMFNLFVELNSEGGRGDAFFIKNMDGNGNWNNFDWINAADGIAYVKFVRENGGNIKVTVWGKNNEASAINMDLTPGDPTANNIELLMYDCGANSRRAVATFAVDFGIEEQPPVDENPKTGDITVALSLAMLVVSGLSATVIIKKKEN